jgi:hypothetical protein
MKEYSSIGMVRRTFMYIGRIECMTIRMLYTQRKNTIIDVFS